MNSNGVMNLKKDTDTMVEFWDGWVEKYPIISIEDGLAENDWDLGKVNSSYWRQSSISRR